MMKIYCGDVSIESDVGRAGTYSPCCKRSADVPDSIAQNASKRSGKCVGPEGCSQRLLLATVPRGVDEKEAGKHGCLECALEKTNGGKTCEAVASSQQGNAYAHGAETRCHVFSDWELRDDPEVRNLHEEVSKVEGASEPAIKLLLKVGIVLKSVDRSVG